MAAGAFEEALRRGLAQSLYPGAAAALLYRGEVVREIVVGRLGYEGAGGPWGEVTPASLYDLASLTKPLAGSLLAAMLVEQGRLCWDGPIATWLEPLAGTEQGTTTPRQILSHAAGYPAWRPLYEHQMERGHRRGREELLALALQELPEAEPGSRVLYSDVGYWTLTALLEQVMGERLDRAFASRIARPLGLARTFFIALPRAEGALGASLSEIAPTSYCPWRGRLLWGEVEDDNASVLGGVAAHAGLFASLKDMETLCLHLRRVFLGERGIVEPQSLAALWRKQQAPAATTWALGWDTPNPAGSDPPSAVGEGFSRRAVGMWGFTGPSLWYDLDRDLFVLCLTNRVHPARERSSLKEFRPALHQAALEEIA